MKENTKNTYDYIVVGLGFAGIALTHLLEKSGRNVLVYENHSHKTTTTAAALYNPVILKRFTPAWQALAQMQLLTDFYQELGQSLGVEITEPLPIFRKFASVEEQNNWFAAADKPVLSQYLSTQIQAQLSPEVPTPFGAGEVRHTGRVRTTQMVQAYTQQLKNKQALREESFDYEALEVQPEGVSYKGIVAKAVIFCEGYGLVGNPFFNYLPLVGSKGELLSFRSEALSLRQVVKSDGFIIPFGGGLFKIGATYHHTDKTTLPTQSAKEELLQKLEKLITCSYEVVDHQAGIRPTVADRRPLVGQHPQHKPLFVLNGLGTRGAMNAPYAAQALYALLTQGVQPEPEMNIQRFENRWKKHQKKL